MLPVLVFPQLDPVLVRLGPFAIRWYALAYIVALLIGWRVMRRIARLAPAVATDLQVDDFLTWAILGVVLGGRLGYVLFYQPAFYLAHPLGALAVWEGGMSFHGGALGVIIAIAVFTWRNGLSFLAFADRLVVEIPIGLGLGRCANFINDELWGRPAPDWLPWAMLFPNSADQLGRVVPRHPSQLYEALAEGAVLLCVMLLCARRPAIRARFGMLSGIFLAGYGVARFGCEFYREPDLFLQVPGSFPNLVWPGATMGQLLSLPMIVAGLGLVLFALRRPRVLA